MVKTEQKIQLGPEKAMPSSNSRSTCKKKYKGVRMRSWGSWVSEIRAPNQKTRIWLGSYSTPEAAARAYDAALICLKGPSANLNFPNSAGSQHFPDTLMSPKSIQRIAAAAAANSNVLSDARRNPQSPRPPCTSSISSSSSTSSPSLSSSPISDVIEDDVSLKPSSNPYLHTFLDEHISMTAPWYNFESPKYTDMLNGAFFDPPMIEDVYEEGDIRLWSFC